MILVACAIPINNSNKLLTVKMVNFANPLEFISPPFCPQFNRTSQRIHDVLCTSLFKEFLCEGLKERMKYMYLRGTSGHPRKHEFESTSSPSSSRKEPQLFPASPSMPMIPEGESHDRHLRSRMWESSSELL